MRRMPAALLWGLGLIFWAGRAYADGKFFAEEVPPKLPYQRAMLLFHDGTETLMVQSKYGLSQSAQVDSIGWVVPVPTVPELTSMDPILAGRRFWMTSFCTQPRTVHVATVVPLILIGVFLLSLLSVPLLTHRQTSLKARGLDGSVCQRWIGLASASEVLQLGGDVAGDLEGGAVTDAVREGKLVGNRLPGFKVL